MYALLHAEVFRLLWYKMCTHIWNYFIGQPVFWKKILYVLLGYLHWLSSPVLWWESCFGNLQYKDNAYN